jgi:DNA-binding MarR family transcriptional regulator
MTKGVARALKQKSKFVNPEQHVVLGLRVLAARLVEPWEKFLKDTAGLTASQYNALRILRGSHPTRLACSEISDRMIARDPDVTRLVDRLSASGLVDRVRAEHDRRVVAVGITPKGIAIVEQLDPHVARMPSAMVGHLGKPKLEQLAQLLDEVLGGLGTFP